MIFYLILSFSAFFLCLLGTRGVILAARQRPEFQHPLIAKRKSIPTGGGVALVMSLIICLLVADIDYSIILAMFLIAAVSLMSDIIEVPRPVQLLVHLLAVLIPVGAMNAPIFSDMIPLWADKMLTAVLWVWFINIWSLMDGVDGIAPMEMISIGTGFSLIIALSGGFPNPLSVYSLIIMSGACGFFWWNWYPAKILLGEVGCAPIGFLMGYLLYIATLSGYAYPAAILPAYYFSDATITFVRRFFQGKSNWVQHTEHYYQKAVHNGHQHDTVVRYIFGLNFVLVFFAVFSVIHPKYDAIYLALAYMCTFVLLGFFAHTRATKRPEKTV